MQAENFSPLHREARRLAQAGTPIFPCIPGGKTPATEHGFHDATTDLTQIDAWWGAEPEYNIAFSPASVGLSVIDLDGVAAQDEWASLELEHGNAPDTYTVETPRPGGRHLYYRGTLPPTQHKLGPHIDTRGVGSYALVPPSVVDGRSEPDVSRHGSYRADRGDAAFAPVPEWVQPLLDSLRKERVKAAVEDLDLPQNIARATKLLKDYVQRGHVAVEYEGGNTTTFAVACEVQNFGVSEDTAFKLINDIWNPACQPPWDDEELATIVANAAAYAQNEAGAWAVGGSEETFGHVLGRLGLDAPEAPRRSKFKGMSLDELAALPPPTWLIPELLPDKRLTLLYGPPGSYKSFIALGYALELAAAGKRVLYVAGEGSRELELRARAWMLLHDVASLNGIQVVGDMPWADDFAQFEEMLEENKDFRPDLVVIDTVARAMVGLNENDAKDMGKFVAFADGIKRGFGAAVLLVHHTGKDESRGARGSGSLMAAVDAAVEIKADKAAMAVEVWVRRMKDAPERSAPWTFEGKPLGQSLVFSATTQAQHRALTHVEDVASNRKVGGALVRLGATSEAAAVVTRVLAAELLKGADIGEHLDEALTKMTRALNAASKDRLEGFALRGGRETTWFVAAAE